MYEKIKDKDIVDSNKFGFRCNDIQKDKIIDKLRDNGYKITRQRDMLLDIILSEECSNCKEIYYKALDKNKKIGIATIYRMLSALENIGALVRSDAYKFPDKYLLQYEELYDIEFNDGSICTVSGIQLSNIIVRGLIKIEKYRKTNIKIIKISPSSR